MYGRYTGAKLKSSAKIRHFGRVLSGIFSLLRKVQFISVFLLIIFVDCNVELRTDEVNGIERQHFGLVGNTHVTQLRAERFIALF